MDEVAARAGVNKSLIYQYFGSKQDLYAEALNYVLMTVTEQSAARAQEFLEAAEEQPFDVVLRILIERQLTMLETFPEYPKLIAWENLEGGRTLSRLQTQGVYQLFIQSMTKFTKPYQDAGVIAKDLDMVQLVQSIMALLHYYVIQKSTQANLFKLDVNLLETRTNWVNQVTRLLMCSMRGENINSV